LTGHGRRIVWDSGRGSISTFVNGKPIGLDILVPSFVSPTAKALKF
jgi:hypothetical protein